MYTVKELIEALQKCPEEYIVCIDGIALYSVGIDHDQETVDLFS